MIAKLVQQVLSATLQELHIQATIFALWAITVKEGHYSQSSVLPESIVQFLVVNLLILVMIARVDIIALIMQQLYL